MGRGALPRPSAPRQGPTILDMEAFYLGIISADKTVSASHIGCGDSFQLKLSLTGQPKVFEESVDVVLLLDVSGSMAGNALAEMKKGAKAFIDILDMATDGAANNRLGAGSHIGIVSFAEAAQQRAPLTQDAALLKNAVDALSTRGNTNHGDGFQKAVSLLNTSHSKRRVLVLFTDGQTTVGPEPAPIAAAAREQGILIYSIGLTGTDGIDEGTLSLWSSDPASQFTLITPDPEDLEELFVDIAEEITMPGAVNARVDEVLAPDFEIMSIQEPTHGGVEQRGPRALRWRIPVLAATALETAELIIHVKYIGEESGMKKVNESIRYTDDACSEVEFPDPSIQVDCDPCAPCSDCGGWPEPVEVCVDGCQSEVLVDVGDIAISGQGCILELSATIKNVCPDCRVAVGVIVTERDHCGREHPCGMKTIEVPAHHASRCRDLRVDCLRFVIPDSRTGEGCGCQPRCFQVRVMANVMDFDFRCLSFDDPCDCGCEEKK